MWEFCLSKSIFILAILQGGVYKWVTLWFQWLVKFKHFFMYLLAIQISSSVNKFKSSDQFPIELSALLIYYYLDFTAGDIVILSLLSSRNVFIQSYAQRTLRSTLFYDILHCWNCYLHIYFSLWIVK